MNVAAKMDEWSHKIRTDHICEKVQVAHIGDKWETIAWDDLAMSCIDLLMHRFLGVKPWWLVSEGVKKRKE